MDTGIKLCPEDLQQFYLLAVRFKVSQSKCLYLLLLSKPIMIQEFFADKMPDGRISILKVYRSEYEDWIMISIDIYVESVCRSRKIFIHLTIS